mgnify:FL=1
MSSDPPANAWYHSERTEGERLPADIVRNVHSAAPDTEHGAIAMAALQATDLERDLASSSVDPAPATARQQLVTLQPVEDSTTKVDLGVMACGVRQLPTLTDADDRRARWSPARPPVRAFTYADGPVFDRVPPDPELAAPRQQPTAAHPAYAAVESGLLLANVASASVHTTDTIDVPLEVASVASAAAIDVCHSQTRCDFVARASSPSSPRSGRCMAQRSLGDVWLCPRREAHVAPQVDVVGDTVPSIVEQAASPEPRALPVVSVSSEPRVCERFRCVLAADDRVEREPLPADIDCEKKLAPVPSWPRYRASPHGVSALLGDSNASSRTEGSSPPCRRRWLTGGALIHEAMAALTTELESYEPPAVPASHVVERGATDVRRQPSGIVADCPWSVSARSANSTSRSSNYRPLLASYGGIPLFDGATHQHLFADVPLPVLSPPRKSVPTRGAVSPFAHPVPFIPLFASINTPE